MQENSPMLTLKGVWMKKNLFNILLLLSASSMAEDYRIHASKKNLYDLLTFSAQILKQCPPKTKKEIEIARQLSPTIVIMPMDIELRNLVNTYCAHANHTCAIKQLKGNRE